MKLREPKVQLVDDQQTTNLTKNMVRVGQHLLVDGWKVVRKQFSVEFQFTAN
jgi:hypothetical protein